MAHALWVCVGLNIILTILYEMVRSLEFNIGIFIFVSMGYPLRLLCGMWTAYPNIWESDFVFQILLVLLAYGFLGEFSVVLPWTHEAVQQTLQGKIIQRSHYVVLFKQIEERYRQIKSTQSTNICFPLRENGKISDIWNYSFLAAIALLAFVALSFGWSWKIFVGELVIFVGAVLYCLAKQEQIILMAAILSILMIGKVFYYGLNGKRVFIACFAWFSQIGCIVLYLFLRYQFEPSFNMKEECGGIFKKIWQIIIGKETWEFLNRADEGKGN